LSAVSYTNLIKLHPVLAGGAITKFQGTTYMNIAVQHIILIKGEYYYLLTDNELPIKQVTRLTTGSSIAFSFTLLEDRWQFTYKVIFLPSYF